MNTANLPSGGEDCIPGQSLLEVNLGLSTSRESQLTGGHLVLPIAGRVGPPVLFRVRGRQENLSRVNDWAL